jgi:hypothetical protein
MLRLAGAAGLLGLALVAAFAPAPAYAQATRTWVSGLGDDANPCSRTAPCKTFAGAISKTQAGGIINCIDPGGFGAVTITKAITIDCTNTKAGVLAAGTNGININAAAADAVTIRGVDIEGGPGSGLVGINYLAGGTVHVERCRIYSFRSGNAAGIRFSVPSGAVAELAVSDTTIVDSGNSSTSGGIIAIATGTANAKVSLNRVQLFNNATGLRVDGSGLTGGGVLSVAMRDSAVSGSSNVGIQVTAGATIVQTLLDNVMSTGNATGLLSSGPGARALITRTTLFGNTTGLDRQNGGDVTSYLDNHINNNFTTNGTPGSTQPPQ